MVSGQHEAWDSPFYVWFGIPSLCLLAGTLGFLEPHHAWRWGFLPFLAQAAWMFGTQEVGNLWPLGLAAFGVLALPSIVAARIGATLKLRRRPIT